ncbi:helix-turn-helix domain-containing protein [Bacillaceae bacterium IKA-2]|nr:helix-turn-helix domain-containing protein [Bacillaceae bacterium IKA-2]
MNKLKADLFEKFPQVYMSQINEYGLSTYLSGVKETLGLDIIVTTDKLEPLFLIGKEKIITFEEDIQRIRNKRELLKKVRTSIEIVSFSIEKETRYIKKLLYEKQVMGYIFIKKETGKLTVKEIKFINDFSDLLTPWVVSERMMRNTDQTCQKSFIFDLLHNHFDSSMEMNEQAKRWGWDFSQAYQLMVIDVGEELRQTTSIEQKVRSVFYLERLDVIITELNHQFVILYLEPKRDNLTKKSSKELAEKIADKITLDEEDHKIRIGIGHLYPSSLDLCRAFQEAKMALKLSKDLDKKVEIMHFKDLGIIKLLANIRQELLTDFYKEQLQELEEYDYRSDEQLIESLRMFLLHNGNVKSCSSELFIHPNTLRNRIKKIEVVLGISLENYNHLNNLITAFKIRDSR